MEHRQLFVYKMADGPCAEEAPSELASLNRVPKERHKCNNNHNELGTNIDKETTVVGSAVRTSDSNLCFVVSVDVDVDVDENRKIKIKSDDDGNVCVDADHDHEDEDEDDEDEDEDEDDEDEDDDGDDEDEVSRSSVISGCVSDEVLLRSSPTPATLDDTLVVVLHPVTVRKKTLVHNTPEVDRTTNINSGIVVPETKTGTGAGAGVGATFEKEPTGVANSFKGQIRNAQDTLVGPCGKKRCVDRYDSSESSDR